MASRSKDAEDPAVAPAVTKSGRVRKKSAKVLEMEEAEKMEKSLSKKVQDTVKGLRETLGGMTVLAKKTPTKVNISIPSLQKSASAADSGSSVNVPVSFMEDDTEPVDTAVQSPVDAVKPVFAATTPAQTGSKRKAEKSTKKNKVKKGKGTPAPLMLDQPPCLEAESPLQINVSNTALPVGGGIPPETTPPLKLKLVLSPNKETPLSETMGVISPSSYDMELDDGGGVLQIAEPTSAPKKRLKKKKKRKRESEGSTGLKTLLIGEAAAKKKKKSSKKQMTMSQSTDEEEFMATMNAFGQEHAEHTETEDGLDMKLPVYANTSEMALKLKTSAERKASKQRKYKKGKTKEDPLKPRKRRAPTAYMLWCASYRQKVITETPGIDFVQMSKRLGELWQALPEKQKMSWKRKARKAATKGTTMISTGKTGHAKSGHVGTLLQSGQHQMKGSTSKRVVSHGDSHAIASQSDQEHKMAAFSVGCQPIDAAAHLKLLGESLSVIGARLKEHVGPGTVQGSVSVLLDSLICALSPLICLTKQVKELDGCSKESLIQTLDNIAYVMPGIG